MKISAAERPTESPTKISRKKNSTLVGRTDEDVPVMLNEGNIGDFVEVEIKGVGVGYVVGRIL